MSTFTQAPGARLRRSRQTMMGTVQQEMKVQNLNDSVSFPRLCDTHSLTALGRSTFTCFSKTQHSRLWSLQQLTASDSHVLCTCNAVHMIRAFTFRTRLGSNKRQFSQTACIAGIQGCGSRLLYQGIGFCSL